MSAFFDLQNGFYNALTQGLGFKEMDPIQLVQPAPPLSTGPQGDILLWNYLNNIPPFSLTQNYISSGGNQFASNYFGLLGALVTDTDNFQTEIGEECFREWKSHLKSLPPTTTSTQLPSIFRQWAIFNGYPSVANKGASALAKILLDPISNGQIMATSFMPPDGTNTVNWVPNLQTLMSQLASAPSRRFSVDSRNMNKNIANTWTKGTNTGFFGLWSNSSEHSTVSETFASSNISVDVKFGHALYFAATPGNWYNSSVMATAYSNKTGKPWDASKPIKWENTFDSKNGNLARFATSLIVVSEMNISVTSDAKFSNEDQQLIYNNSNSGLWPFYTSGGASGSNTSVVFDKDGRMFMDTTSAKDIPIVVALTVLPVNEYLGHHLR